MGRWLFSSVGDACSASSRCPRRRTCEKIIAKSKRSVAPALARLVPVKLGQSCELYLTLNVGRATTVASTWQQSLSCHEVHSGVVR